MPESFGRVTEWASRQKDKYFGQNETASESKLEKLSSIEKQHILNNTEIHADDFNLEFPDALHRWSQTRRG